MSRTKEKHPRCSNLRLSPDQRDFLRRRTRPFLDSNGVERSLPFLLEEAYIQGLRDATQVLTETVQNETFPQLG